MISRFLDHNPLDLVERSDTGRAVVELGRARAFVRCHSLGVFKRAARHDARTRGVSLRMPPRLVLLIPGGILNL